MSERLVEHMSPAQLNDSFRKMLGILSSRRWHAGYRDSIRVRGTTARNLKKKRVRK